MRTLLGLSLLSILGLAQSQESSPLSPIAAEEVVRRLQVQMDYYELDLGEPFPVWNNQDADVAKASSEIRSRLMVRPQDTQTLLLWARLGPRNPTDSLPTREGALDRVLAAEPHNAEALYYKGRIYGTPVWVSSKTAKRQDLNRAISFLRLAVEFAPNNLKYRKTLALFLVDQGHSGEAKATLSAAPKDDPIVKLLEELASLPIPEGAENFFDHPLLGMSMFELGASGTVENSLHLRVRLYRISKSPAAIGDFYATRIPGFQFIPVKRGAQNAKSEFESEYVQFLRMKSGAMRPSGDLQEIPHPRKREPGILMSLVEMRNDPELGRELSPGENNCYLLLVNSRK